MSDYKYYTPVALFQEVLACLPPKEIHTIIDISCGSFNLLKAALFQYPEAEYTGVDIDSQDIPKNSQITFFKQDGRIFAQRQYKAQKFYDLILTNPPFGRLKNEYRIFQNEPTAILSSRYECEMMHANMLLATEGSIIVAILPATFIEGDLYWKYRKMLAEEYQICSLIHLPKNVFSKGEINSYAIIISKNTKGSHEHTQIGLADFTDQWKITFSGDIEPERIRNGIWDKQSTFTLNEPKHNVTDIFRGNISSSFFSDTGEKVLHCSSLFPDGKWTPSIHYCQNVDLETQKVAKDGDILINRIGKSAGFWVKYHGSKCLVSDCIIVISGGIGIEAYLDRHSTNGRIILPIKGVATKYISISDLKRIYFEIS